VTPLPILMTIADAAAFVGTTEDKTKRERRAGRLTSVYLDSKPRVKTAELIAWAESAPTDPPGSNA